MKFPVKFFDLFYLLPPTHPLGKGKEVRDLKPNWRVRWEIYQDPRCAPMP